MISRKASYPLNRRIRPTDVSPSLALTASLMGLCHRTKKYYRQYSPMESESDRRGDTVNDAFCIQHRTAAIATSCGS